MLRRRALGDKLDAIAVDLGLTKQRVSQIEYSAMKHRVVVSSPITSEKSTVGEEFASARLRRREMSVAKRRRLIMSGGERLMLDVEDELRSYTDRHPTLPLPKDLLEQRPKIHVPSCTEIHATSDLDEVSHG